VSTVTYSKNPGSALATLTLVDYASLLKLITLPAAANVSLLWGVGGVLDDNGRSNWSGFMQSVCQGQHPAVATLPQCT
jgi:hypothetical protein